ncbi:hypothetical protein B0A49_10747 [Cryomyces minteri]|uniref:Gfd2/YDR514C-like C-terminal domain-containing protein n=1 Tax=Cryomyces minteri TaxID=331657 RepID=A0A4U0WPE4_9PEZI|nr:hypothetical protein B0A49_10747 [Cryomyces minteri]
MLKDRLYEQLDKTTTDMLHLNRYLGLQAPRKIPGISDFTAHNPSRPAPYPFLSDAVLVAIDVEGNMVSGKRVKSHHSVTEVGVSVLDTRDLVSLPPGTKACNWLEKIRSRHFYITKWSRKKRPRKFMFGISELIDIETTPDFLTSVFRIPLEPPSAGFSASVWDGVAQLLGFRRPLLEPERPARNIVLIGHGTYNDLYNLNVLLNCDVYAAAPVVGHIDTSVMAVDEGLPASLEELATEFELSPENLHNAGNDAAYTMRVLLIMAVLRAEFGMRALPYFPPWRYGLRDAKRRRRLVDGNLDDSVAQPAQ